MALFSKSRQAPADWRTQLSGVSLQGPADYYNIGRALGLGLGGMFGAFPEQAKPEKEMEFMSALVSGGVDLQNPQALVDASRVAKERGLPGAAERLMEMALKTRVETPSRNELAAEFVKDLPYDLTEQEGMKKAAKELREAGFAGTGVWNRLSQDYAASVKESKRAAEKEEKAEVQTERYEAGVKAEEAERMYSDVFTSAGDATNFAVNFLTQKPPKNMEDAEESLSLAKSMGANVRLYDKKLQALQGNVTPSRASEYYSAILDQSYDTGERPAALRGDFPYVEIGLDEKAYFNSELFGRIADGVFGIEGGYVPDQAALRLAKQNKLIPGVSRIKDESGRTVIITPTLLRWLQAQELSGDYSVRQGERGYPIP